MYDDCLVGRCCEKRKAFCTVGRPPQRFMSSSLSLHLQIVCCDALHLVMSSCFYSEHVSFFLVFYCCGGECKGVFPPPYDSVCSSSALWCFLFPFWYMVVLESFPGDRSGL